MQVQLRHLDPFYTVKLVTDKYVNLQLFTEFQLNKFKFKLKSCLDEYSQQQCNCRGVRRIENSGNQVFVEFFEDSLVVIKRVLAERALYAKVNQSISYYQRAPDDYLIAT